MAIKEGLRIALNEIRQTSIDNNTLYAKYVDEIYPTTDISAIAQPILANEDLVNEFLNVLAKRIVYTQVEIRVFNNPLQQLEGEMIPLGAIGQEIFINSAKGRKFDVNDFAGLLAKYESDVKVQYLDVNSDLQYCVTITKDKLRNAFVSWENLNEFVDGITQSLYNGCYIDRFNMTKALVSQAYVDNNVQIEVVTNPSSSESYAKAFIQKAREIYLNMQLPSTRYNAWAKVGGYGRAIKTWCNPEDIVFIFRNDLASYIDVNVLANSFNITKSELLGRIIYTDSFDVYDNDETLLIDGSNIYGMMCDKKWFRVKTQDFAMNEFFNANNRCWNLYLNDTRMYKYSLFANAVVFASELPDIKATKVEFVNDTAFEIEEGEKVTRKLKIEPVNFTSQTTFTSGDSTKVSVRKISDTEVEITGGATDATAVTSTASNNSQTDTISVTCVEGD